MYITGRGVAENDAEALKWLHLAADHGNAHAEDNLGIVYATGKGVTKDDAEALKWFRRAADHGDPQAQYNLGVRYARGEDVEQDYNEAMKWYRMAADEEYPEAENNLGVMYDNGQGVAQDEVVAVTCGFAARLSTAILPGNAISALCMRTAAAWHLTTLRLGNGSSSLPGMAMSAR
jgi:TPR repeat protein